MTLGRRNSIATSVLLPCHLTLPRPLSSTFSATATSSSSSSSFATSSSSSSDYFSLLPTTKPSIPSYTSLKDLIPASSSAANSPTAAGAPATGDIPIRNRLVKQAAYAYLQPMSASPDSASDGLFRRVSDGVLRTPLFSLLCSVARLLINAFCFCFL